MGYWGVKSYENDLAHDALDAGFDRIHGERYEALMDDRNPLPYEKVHEQLASPVTLAASLEALNQLIEEQELEESDGEAQLAWVGVVLRHAECRVEIGPEIIQKAIEILESEDLDWPRPTERKLRLEKEVAVLRKRLENR